MEANDIQPLLVRENGDKKKYVIMYDKDIDRKISEWVRPLTHRERERKRETDEKRSSIQQQKSEKLFKFI